MILKDLHHQKLVRDALMRKETAEVDLKDHESSYEKSKTDYEEAMKRKKLDKFKPLSESHALTVRFVSFFVDVFLITGIQVNSVCHCSIAVPLMQTKKLRLLVQTFT